MPDQDTLKGEVQLAFEMGQVERAVELLEQLDGLFTSEMEKDDEDRS